MYLQLLVCASIAEPLYQVMLMGMYPDSWRALATVLLKSSLHAMQGDGQHEMATPASSWLKPCQNKAYPIYAPCVTLLGEKKDASPLRWSSNSKLPAKLLSHHWLFQICLTPLGFLLLKCFCPLAVLESLLPDCLQTVESQ